MNRTKWYDTIALMEFVIGMVLLIIDIVATLIYS